MMIKMIKVSNKIVASGGFADIRPGTYKGYRVAVKTLRVANKDDFLKIGKVSVSDILSASWNAALTILLQQFCKEVILWKTLSHPNVLRLVGVRGDMSKGQFITVSTWMAHGNIMEYIRKNHVNRLELVRGFTAHPTSFAKMRQTVARGGSGSEVSPRHQCSSRRSQRGQRLFVSRQLPSLLDIQ